MISYPLKTLTAERDRLSWRFNDQAKRLQVVSQEICIAQIEKTALEEQMRTLELHNRDLHSEKDNLQWLNKESSPISTEPEKKIGGGTLSGIDL